MLNYLECDKLVVFCDSEDDINLFSIADEAYAVSNASDVLKQKATGIIDAMTMMQLSGYWKIINKN